MDARSKQPIGLDACVSKDKAVQYRNKYLSRGSLLGMYLINVQIPPGSRNKVRYALRYQDPVTSLHENLYQNLE